MKTNENENNSKQFGANPNALHISILIFFLIEAQTAF